MHPLNNGSQATTKPTPKARVGTQGYFTESGENNTPSYPGADWFNAVIDEFLAMLTEMSIEFNPDKFNHWQRAMAALKDDATSKANDALSSAKSYADTQDATVLASAKADASSKADAALSEAKTITTEQLQAHTAESDPHTQYLQTAELPNQMKDNASLGIVLNTDGPSADKLPSAWPYSSQVVAHKVYKSGYPEDYGNLLTSFGSGKTQLFQSWAGNTSDEGPSHLYLRMKRDSGGDVFGPWSKVWDSYNHAAATEAIAIAGTDTSHWMNAQATEQHFLNRIADLFPQSNQYLSINGNILQWGTGRGAGQVTLPIEFPNNFYLVLVTNTDRQGDRVDNAFGYVVDNATFYAASKSSVGNDISGASYSWLAIGD